MSPAILVLLLAASPGRMAFGSGSVAIPEGCTAPATVKWNVDWFLGTIECPEARVSISVTGGMVESACPSDVGAKVRSATLRTLGGTEVVVCSWHPEGNRQQKFLAAEVGLASIRADVQNAVAARLFQEVVSSYRDGPAK